MRVSPLDSERVLLTVSDFRAEPLLGNPEALEDRDVCGVTVDFRSSEKTPLEWLSGYIVLDSSLLAINKFTNVDSELHDWLKSSVEITARSCPNEVWHITTDNVVHKLIADTTLNYPTVRQERANWPSIPIEAFPCNKSIDFSASLYRDSDSAPELDSIQLQLETELDISKQLDQLRSLEDGWLNGEGVAPSAEHISALAEAFSLHFPSSAILPHLYPTETGGVQAEWSFEKREISFEIDLESRSGYWHELDIKRDIVTEKELNIDDAVHWSWLVGRLREKV